MIFRAHLERSRDQLSVSGLLLGVPNRSLAVRMGMAVRIAAMIPSTGLRPSSMRGMVAYSPFVRHRAEEVLGEGLPTDGAGEEDSNLQASTIERYVRLAEVIVLRVFCANSSDTMESAAPVAGQPQCRAAGFTFVAGTPSISLRERQRSRARSAESQRGLRRRTTVCQTRQTVRQKDQQTYDYDPKRIILSRFLRSPNRTRSFCLLCVVQLAPTERDSPRFRYCWSDLSD